VAGLLMLLAGSRRLVWVLTVGLLLRCVLVSVVVVHGEIVAGIDQRETDFRGSARRTP
jgi:hypothetical protein